MTRPLAVSVVAVQVGVHAVAAPTAQASAGARALAGRDVPGTAALPAGTAALQ